MNCLSPSILAADFSILGEQVKMLDEAGAQCVHIDVMDGKFVPNISFGIPVISSIRKCSKRIFDVHLMIDEPVKYVWEFAQAGADLITVHVEACRSIEFTLEEIKRCGVKAGVAINPATPVEVLEPIIDKADMILVMTVNPGAGGQSYIEDCTDKIRAVRAMLDSRGLRTDIQVDGGIKENNLAKVLEAGANVIVAGSAIFKGDIKENVDHFLNIMGEYSK